MAYIRNQAQRHEKMTFQDEYRRLLERYQVALNMCGIDPYRAPLGRRNSFVMGYPARWAPDGLG